MLALYTPKKWTFPNNVGHICTDKMDVENIVKMENVRFPNNAMQLLYCINICARVI